MRKLKIGIDLDDVINELLASWINELNKTHGRNIQPFQVNTWDFKHLFPGITAMEYIRPLTSNEFWASLPMKPEADKYIKKLYGEGHKVYVVTATHYENIPVKVRWLIKRLPFILPENIIVTHHKHLLSIDVLVDDYEENLRDGAYEKILFSAPHNMKFDETEIAAVRVNCWHQAYQVINKIAKGELPL